MTGSIRTERLLKATKHFFVRGTQETITVTTKNNNPPLLSLCAAKQNDSSSCLLYVLLIEISSEDTQHKGWSRKQCALYMTSLGTFRRDIDLKLPRCRVCTAAAITNLPSIPCS